MPKRSKKVPATPRPATAQGSEAGKWYAIDGGKNSQTTKVMLYDDIGRGGKSAGQFIEELDAIDTPQIDLHINCFGGEIYDGLACYNAVKKHPAQIAVHIDGLAASVASLIAIAGDTVSIAKNAFVMIHDGWGMAIGGPDEMRKQADVLDKLCTSIAQAYADKTGKSIEECRKAMVAETWFNATEAKEWGLVDEIDGESDEQTMAATVMLAVARYSKAPIKLRRFAARLVRAQDDTTKRKDADMDKLVNKDGKWFLGDDEVDVSDVLAIAKPAESTEATEPTEATDKALAKARQEGMTAGRKEEATYRLMFNTVVASAKLDAPATAEFEKTFYGRDEKDLKFLASHAIGQRAKPIGEAAPGNAEGEQSSDDDEADKKLVATATTRFADNPDVRSAFGLSLQATADDPDYKATLTRYLARQRSWARDQKKAKETSAANAQ